jgi:hypothetical protein
LADINQATYHGNVLSGLQEKSNKDLFFGSVSLMLPSLHLITLSPMKLAFCCLLAPIAFLKFSGNPLFFAALFLALISDFAGRGVFIVKPNGCQFW